MRRYNRLLRFGDLFVVFHVFLLTEEDSYNKKEDDTGRTKTELPFDDGCREPLLSALLES